MAERKLRIAWFTPLARFEEPVVTISQYCSDILLPLMRDEFEIEVFSGLSPGTHLGFPRYNTLNAYQRHRVKPFDLFFYQIEDGSLGRVVRTQVGIMPGVTWMHDTFLSDPGAEGIHTSPWERSLQQMLDLSLPFLERDDLPLQPQPSGDRETSVSPVVLYNNEWGEGTLHRFISGRLEYVQGGHRSEYLPVPASLIADARPAEYDRPLRVLVYGTTGLEGRAHKILPALADVKTPCALTWVIDPSQRADAQRMVNEFGVGEKVTFVEGNYPERWRSLVAQSDIALLLNSNPHGRLSPYLELSMAAAVPTVVMRSGRGERISAEHVFVVEPGLHETAQILGVLESVSQESSRRLGEEAQNFALTENDPRRVAAKLRDIFIDSAPGLAAVMRAWDGLYHRGGVALLDEVRALVDAPVGGMPGASELIVAPFVEELRRFADASK